MDYTESLKKRVERFISLDGYSQHEELGEYAFSNSPAYHFWMYLRVETLNRRIVHDGWA